MLKSLKVEKLVVSAIPTLVDTWTVGFGFQPLEEDERRSLSKTNLMVFPGSVWLKKPLNENSTMDEISGELSWLILIIIISAIIFCWCELQIIQYLLAVVDFSPIRINFLN